MQSLTFIRQHESIESSFSGQRCRRERAAGMFGLARMVCIAFALCAAFTIAAPAQTFNTLLSFDGTDGGYPYYESLIQGTDGNYYGTTTGGQDNLGTIFSITPAGTLTNLYSFCPQSGCTDGQWPYAGLMQATNGNFYGTTYEGGANGEGAVFELTPEPGGGCPSGSNTGNGWCETVLYSFCAQTNCTDGYRPYAALIQATNGNLYGTADDGGAHNGGTVFEITLAGKLTTLYSFCLLTDCKDGQGPNGLVQATNGNFYGTTTIGGEYDEGTVFEITPAGKLTTLYSFCSKTACADGDFPEAGLVQATNGSLYGTTSSGGNGGGTVFKITPGGKLTTLHTFCSETDCTDGSGPSDVLVQATDGNFYGTTTGKGPNGEGTVFEITPAGSLTTLHGFGGADGEDLRGGVMQATNGTFYGTTTSGGANDYGTVFSLSTGLGPFVETIFTSGKVGASLIILGNNLTGTTSVSFNGAAATFTVVSDSEITTTVPAGATTGTVTVTTPSSTLDSNVIFRVTPQISSFTPTSGPAGTTVTITGVSLTQTTKITFGGVAATTFTVDSDTQVTATVPASAKTGKIGITTPGGTATSSTTFTVTQ